jgi:hypothetical protein
VHEDVLEGIGCLSKIIPSDGTIIEETVQIIGETAETTSAVVKSVDGADGVTEIKMEDIKSGEPVLPDQTIGFNIGTELGTCTVLGSLVKGPQADLFRAIIGYEGKLLNKFEKSLQFYLDQPQTVRDKTLKGCGFHHGQKVCIELNVGVFEDGSSDFADGWVRLSGGRVVPDSLERRGWGAAINTKILLNFGDLTLSSTEILFENIEDTGQISLRKILAVPYSKIKDYLRNDEVSAKVLIRDPSAIDVLTGGVGPQSGTVFLGAGESAFPPSPPTINASSRQNSIKLSLSGENAEQFQIYRSTNSGFSAEELEPIEVISGNSYTDEGLVAGRNYYYKAVAVASSGKSSNPSSEVSGRLQTNYRLAGLEDGDLSRNAYSLGTLSGRLETVEDGAPVPGANVSLSIPEIELSVAEVQTDENGEFSVEYRTPGKTGEYDLELNARADDGARTRSLSLAVQERPEWGRDLAIPELVLTDSLTAGGETLETGAETENRGDEHEDATLSYRLLNRSGTNIASITQNLSLSSGEGRSIPADISIPADLEAGSYQLQASIENSDDLDRERANNRATKDVYAPSEEYSTTTYRSKERTIEGEGTTKTIDGTEVTLLNVADTSVSFEVDEETTGPLPVEGGPQLPWTSSSNGFLILKEGITVTGDTVTSVTFQGGGKAPGASVSPERIQEKRGRETAFRVKVPEGQTPDPSNMTFPYGPDAGALENWKNGAENESLGPRTVALGLEVSSSAELRTYSGWLEWGGSSETYYKRVAVRPRPIHDLALTGVDIQSTIEGGDQEIPDFIPGAPVDIEGQLENRGDFQETQPIEVKIESDGETVYTERVEETTLAKRDGPGDPNGGTYSFSFSWPTVGMQTGTYQVIVQSPHSADENPDDDTYTEEIELQKPPKVSVDIQDTSAPYEVGDEIPLRVFVGRKDQPFSGAAVSATLIRPTGEEEEISLDYNSETELYEASSFANHGGNYRAEVQAQRVPYRPGAEDSLFAQTYVDVSASLGEDTVDVGRTQTLRIRTSNVAGLHGFSGDVVYDEGMVGYLRAAGSPLLGGSKDVQTTVQAEDRGGRVITGATRLGAEGKGVTSTQGGRILALGFVGRTAGETTFSLEEVSLIDQEGKAMATRVTSGAPTLAVEEEPAAVSVSVQDTVSTATQRDTAQITLTNAFRAEGFGGTISFSSSSVRAVDIVEGTVFNENGDAETLFASDIDQEEGTAQFSITRTGDQPGISVGSAPIARLIYEPKAPGKSPIALEEGTVMSGRQDITLPSFSLSDTLAVTGAADSTQTTLSFSPLGRTPSRGETFSLAVTAENVTDLFSVATTVAFDPNLIDFVDIQEGDFLSEDGDVSTSFTHDVDQSAGTIVAGLSRLGKDVGGVSTEEPDTLFTLQFERTGEAQSRIELTNTGLLRPDGETEIPYRAESARVNSPPTAESQVPPDTLKIPSPPVQLTNLGGTVFSDPGGDELTFSASSNDPAVVEAVGEFSEAVTLEPQGTGTADVIVTASDGLAETDTSFSATVEERSPSDEVPAEQATAIVEVTEGDTADVGFGDTGASATFHGIQTGGMVDASFFATGAGSPGSEPPYVPDDPFENVSPYRWKISAGGASSESVALSIDLDDSDVEGVQVPQDVTIIRDAQGNGTYDIVETTYDNGGTPLDTLDDVLVAEGISGFSTFRLASDNSDNPLGSTLDRPNRIGFDINRVFGGASGPSDYRLVALPGQVERPLGDAVSGDAGSEWQAFWDDGSAEDYLVEHDGSETFAFRPGRGFWLTSRQEWTLSDSVKAVPLGEDQATAIPLHEGWNIISNPMRENVLWSAVETANSDSLQPVWAFEGSFRQADTLGSAATGQAYYFLNDQGLGSLTVPYPTASKSEPKEALPTDRQGKKTGPGEAVSMTLAATAGDFLRSEARVGIGQGAAEGLDVRDVVAPPSRFSALSLRLEPRGEHPDRRGRLAAEWRPPATSTEGNEDGHTFSLRLRAKASGPANVKATGLEAFQDQEVALLRSSTGQSWDLREKEAVTLRDADSTALKLAVGSAAYVEDQEQDVVPDEVTLTSYPNPLQEQGTIEYTLPEATDVRITVYDVLGRRVAVLEDSHQEAGRHTARLDGGRLASGVYFGRLETDGQTRTQKITVVR